MLIQPLRDLLWILALVLSVCVFAANATAKDRPMNVVMIVADDLGWSDTTLYGHTKIYRTPNLERLAKRGMVFTHAYSASPLCSPTRSAILTGLSPARTGITTPNCHLPQVVLKATPGKAAPPGSHTIMPHTVTRLNTDYPTLAKSLKKAGYATGHFGKWHLGSEPYSPLQHGFDVDLPHHAGPGPAGSYVAPWKFKGFDADPNVPDQHIEDRMATEATAFMEQHKDKPFYLNYWMFSVHAPFDAKRALIEKYRKQIDPNSPQRCPTYAAMVESMDDAVGTLLDKLDQLGISDNTIIIFTSDNGGNTYNEVEGVPPTSNAPLRGGKASMFEGGTRVPCVIVWPQVTAPGSKSDVPIQSEDYYPTLLAGLNREAETNQTFDGTNMMPALKGDTLASRPLFQYFPHSPPVPEWIPPSISVHQDAWKLIRIFYAGEAGAHRYLLFNLKEDIGERRNIAAEHVEKVKELDLLISRFLEETKAVIPIVNPAFDIRKYRPELEGIRPAAKQAKPRNRAKAKATMP